MSFLDAFADAHRRGQAHFNEGDFEQAFAGLAPDVEWHMLARLLEAGTVKGRDAVVRYFQRVLDGIDWQVHVQEFEDLGGGRVLVRQRGTATGRSTRISGDNEFFQIWTIGSDGLTHEVREFESRDDALQAVAPRATPVAEMLRASTEAFNRGDFHTAFAGVAPGVEWHPGEWVFDAGVIRSRDALIAFYESIEDAGDWHVTLLDVTDLGGGRLMTHQHGVSRGRTTGIEASRESFLVWTFGDDGLIHEMREFATREEALAAAARA